MSFEILFESNITTLNAAIGKAAVWFRRYINVARIECHHDSRISQLPYTTSFSFLIRHRETTSGVQVEHHAI